MRLPSLNRVSLAAALSFAYLACDGTSTGPLTEIGNDVEFFAPISFAELQDNARASGALTVEIDLLDGSLVAKDVAIQFSEPGQVEEIDSRIKAMSVDGASGAMTVALGDLVVSFNGETRLLNGEGNEIGFEAFVAEVQAALGAGEEPTVLARRAGGTVQAPDDPTFAATEIQIGASSEDESRLVVNVTLDNLILNDAPPPDAWIHALNLMIELRVREGITRITIENPEFERVEFEGVIESVDLAGNSVTLQGGAVVRLVDDTKIRFEDGQHNHLRSLAAVQEALSNGQTVVAYGVGVLESGEPRVLVAIKVAFLVREPPMEHFSGKVLAVDLEARTLTLHENVVVRVDENTQIRPPEHAADLHYLPSLEAAAEAIGAGKVVEAAGKGIVESEGEGGVQILAIHMVIEVELPPAEGFEGMVTSVDLENGSVTVARGEAGGTLVVNITEETKILESDHDNWRLGSLEAVAQALEGGETVLTHGRGFIADEEPLTLDAIAIAFYLEPPDLTEFEGTVASIDAEGGSLTLADGTVIVITDETRFKLKEYQFDHADVPVLEIVRRVLEAGVPVGASGAGIAADESNATITAVVLVFHFEFLGELEFAGTVESVNVEGQTFTLDNGLTVHIIDNLTIDVGGDLTSLAAVAEALAGGEVTVHCEGRAVLLVEGELVKAVAVFVRFGT